MLKWDSPSKRGGRGGQSRLQAGWRLGDHRRKGRSEGDLGRGCRRAKGVPEVSNAAGRGCQWPGSTIGGGLLSWGVQQ